MKTLFFLCLVGIFNLTSFGQDDWLKYTSKDSLSMRNPDLNFYAKKGKVTVHKDARLDKLSDFVRSGESTPEGVKIDGFRIMIFFDQDKSMVSQQKASFLARYGHLHKAYIDYSAPNYRLRVGNFRTRLEAEGLKAELAGFFPTAVVVEDKIQLPAIPNQ